MERRGRAVTLLVDQIGDKPDVILAECFAVRFAPAAARGGKITRPCSACYMDGMIGPRWTR